MRTIYDNSGIVTATDIYYILSDHLNTPRKITDDTGTVLWSWNSDAFGTTQANQDVDGDNTIFEFNLRFPGQYFDKESGEHYNYFRDYEPSTGRYLESDPIGLEGGMNTFGYVDNNPILNIDKNGLIACKGEWERAKTERILPMILNRCACYWLCFPCDGTPIMWSGNPYGLPSTRGNSFYDGNGSIKKPDACICAKPGPDEDCDACEKNS